MVQCWKSVSKDFNRFIQRVRRLHNSQVQYIRCIEAHQDCYPHLHAILQFSTPQTVLNRRYFDRTLYLKWKQLWSSGLSDFQPPKSKQQPLFYLMKYISKSTNAHKTLWRKLIVQTSTQTATNAPTKQEDANEPSADSVKFAVTLLKCKEFKLRQLSWSRGFKYPKYEFGQNRQLNLVRVPEIALSNTRKSTQKLL